MRNLIFGILAIGLGAFYYITTPPNNTDWVLGTWELKTKIKESKIENFTFMNDGKMVFGNRNGVVYDDCTYAFYDKSTIDFECNINGKLAVFPLTVSDSNRVITMTNGNQFGKNI
jgi:hypothetical protein